MHAFPKMFKGSQPTEGGNLIMNEELRTCEYEEENGKVYSYINVQVKAGQQLTIKTE